MLKTILLNIIFKNLTLVSKLSYAKCFSQERNFIKRVISLNAFTGFTINFQQSIIIVTEIDSPLIAAKATAPSSHATTLTADIFVSLVARLSPHIIRASSVRQNDLEAGRRVTLNRVCAVSRDITSLAARLSYKSDVSP